MKRIELIATAVLTVLGGSTYSSRTVPFPYQTNATTVSVAVPIGAQNRLYRLRKI